MLSILIPVYNYDIRTLVNELLEQLETAPINYEICCLDDCSNVSFQETNLSLNNLSEVTYTISEVNQGIAVTRQKLVVKATNDWVILLDADTKIPDNFIANYIKQMSADTDFIFGGFKYDAIPPDRHHMLRWKYGIKYEALSAKNRNSNPYKVTIAANLLVRRSSYLNLNLDSMGNNYAMDYYFGSLLKSTKASVKHIDNQVTHLGIESSSTYLKKKELAVKTLLSLYKQGKLEQHSNDLLKAFLLSKKIGFQYVWALLFKLAKRTLINNLTGSNPKVKLLQFYKLGYMCQMELRKLD